MQSRERADKGARQLLLSLGLVCHRLIVHVGVGTYMYVSTSQSIVCEWHQFQGLNVVIDSQYRHNFRACGGLGGNLITPSRTRPPVGARLVVPTHCLYPYDGPSLRGATTHTSPRPGVVSTGSAVMRAPGAHTGQARYDAYVAATSGGEGGATTAGTATVAADSDEGT